MPGKKLKIVEWTDCEDKDRLDLISMYLDVAGRASKLRG